MDLIINLQLFSEEKTEKPTPKKIRESREKGQVLQSKEVNSAIVLMIAFVVLKLFSNYMAKIFGNYTNYVYIEYLSLEYAFSIKNLHRLFVLSVYNIFLIVSPIMAASLLIGLIISYMQVGYLFTFKTLAPKFSKLNPIEGFKKMFSMKSLVELVKSFVKIILVSYVVYQYAIGKLDYIFNTIAMEVNIIVHILKDMAINIGFRAAMVLIFLAILDYYYQRYEYEKGLKMSKQEIKEEYKQMEGNPQIKSKIREKQRQISMRRMMQDVPKADVIITNPTHYAIAIQYNPNEFDAPKLTAKGVDLIAQNIKKIAKEHSIPMVENKVLARTLYDTVEIGQLIPPELYQSVAEVLAYIYQINKKM